METDGKPTQEDAQNHANNNNKKRKLFQTNSWQLGVETLFIQSMNVE